MKLCALMAVVLVVTMLAVAVLVFTKPQNLMLRQQDKLDEATDLAAQVHTVARMVIEEKPKTALEAFRLMEKIQASLSERDR